MKKIILVNGLPRAGKDTFADYLVKYHNYKKLSFATALKDIIAKSFNITLDELDKFKNDNVNLIYEETNGFNDNLLNFRDLLRRFGTEAMKPYFGKSVWSDIVYSKIKDSKHNKFVISDFRFLSEYTELEDTEVITVLIKDERELPKNGHSSDTELYNNLFKFDIVLENTGSIDDFYNNIANLEFL